MFLPGAEASNLYSSWRAPWAPETWSQGPEPEAPETPEGACLVPQSKTKDFHTRFTVL